MISFSRRVLLAALFAASLALRAAEPPTAEQLKSAEKTFRELFGKDYDKISKSKSADEKVKYARKLCETAGATKGDAAIVQVLGEKAFPLAHGDLWKAAAETFPAEKAYLLGQARRHYAAGAAAYPMHAAAGRAKLLARELPPFRPIGVCIPSTSFAMELLDEPEQGEATLALWAKAACKASASPRRIASPAISPSASPSPDGRAARPPFS
jgi:hypothetical protein